MGFAAVNRHGRIRGVGSCFQKAVGLPDVFQVVIIKQIEASAQIKNCPNNRRRFNLTFRPLAQLFRPLQGAARTVIPEVNSIA